MLLTVPCCCCVLRLEMDEKSKVGCCGVSRLFEVSACRLMRVESSSFLDVSK